MNHLHTTIRQILWSGLCISAAFAMPLIAWADDAPGDSARYLDEVVITSLYKGAQQQKMQSMPTAIFNMKSIERARVTSIKDLSALVPNYYIPDYGSRMTSSMYVRGLGARIDNPVMGLYVDGVPYFNKNNFDFDFSDIRSVTVLRGPQGTLFGRNAMGGVIDISTLSPFIFQGTRIKLEGGNGGSYGGRLSTYRIVGDSLGVSANLYYNHTDGYYTNHFDNSHCDNSDNAGLRLRLQKRFARTELDNSLGVSWLNQGGYPYRYLNSATGQLAPVNYNDVCGYRRLNVNDGLSYKWYMEGWTLTSVSAYQFTHDNMRLDQDFLPLSMFTLQQKQDEHVLSQEFIFKSPDKGLPWKTLTGLMAYGRYLGMEAPVTFKQDGINRLILAGANKGIQTAFPGDSLLFSEKQFVIGDNFTTWTAGGGFYHNVSREITPSLSLEAGLRIEMEKSWFHYNSTSLVHYLFSYNMTEYRALATKLRGNESNGSLELLPRLSLTWHKRDWSTYLSVAKGYKSGGFNTQLFSDILQSAMMKGLLNSMGLSMPGLTTYTVGEVVKYKPEYSYNYEWGFRYHRGAFKGEAVLFYMDCRDQQLTVFPAGTNTGRMMTNAGRTRNMGVEATADYSHGRWHLNASWGFTDATFRRYVSGTQNYRGNYIPYVPRHTVSAGADYTLPVAALWLDRITLHADWRAVGPIYWDEANTVKQNFYGLFNGTLRMQRKGLALEMWGRNLTGEEYNVFYFVSMQNRFLQQGKPRQWGVSLQYEF